MKSTRALAAVVAVGAAVLASCAPAPATDSKARVVEPVVVTRLAHDPASFTQGLDIVDDKWSVESTGLYGQSRLNVLDENGERVDSIGLPDDVFGEGVAVSLDTVYVLTWKEHSILRYRWPVLAEMEALPLDTQGWGACFRDGTLWTTDGTDQLVSRDPATGQRVGAPLTVTRDGVPVKDLNELECLPDGTFWANVWMSNDIVHIAADGAVDLVLDASVLTAEVAASQPLGPDDVLNGIAARSDGTLLVTGKHWPGMFVLEDPRTD